MFKKILTITILTVLAGILVIGAVNRTLAKTGSSNNGNLGNAGQDQSNSYLNADNSIDNGDSSFLAGEQLANLPPADPAGLSEAEAAALAYMREEEKLAHDVYVTLYDQWGLATFQNIAASEQTHTQAVKALLDRYVLADPTAAAMGVFSKPDLQSLYDQLVARGNQSLAEAIKVGGAIEELDILDLQARLEQSNNADILQVFNSLLNGSTNHLRAFTSVLTAQTGESYQPQYLSTQAYQSLVGAGTTGATGGRNGQGGNGQVSSGQGGNGQDGSGQSGNGQGGNGRGQGNRP